jgi:Gram-negative bacterial TonB protein C-terminal
MCSKPPLNHDEVLFRHRNRQYGAFVLRRQVVRNTLVGVFAMFLSIALLVVLSIGESAPHDKLSTRRTILAPVEQCTVQLIEVAIKERGTAERIAVSSFSALPQSHITVVQQGMPAQHAHNFVFIAVPPDAYSEPALDVLPVSQTTPVPLVVPVSASHTSTLMHVPKTTPRTGYVQGDLPLSTIADVFEDYQLTERPNVLNTTQWQLGIQFPVQARELGYNSGRVVLRVQFDAQGRVEAYHVVFCTHPLFLRAIEHHIPRMHVSPGRIAGQPVRSRLTVPVRFSVE